MAKTKATNAVQSFESVMQSEVPKGRMGKHHDIVGKLLSDLAILEAGRALKVPLEELADSKENVRSALNRATRALGLQVATASDSEFLYVWKESSKNGK